VSKTASCSGLGLGLWARARAADHLAMPRCAARPIAGGGIEVVVRDEGALERVDLATCLVNLRHGLIPPR
jgi:hypothetical protein